MKDSMEIGTMKRTEARDFLLIGAIQFEKLFWRRNAFLNLHPVQIEGIYANIVHGPVVEDER